MFKYYFCPVDIGEEELSSVEFEGENVLCIKDDMLRKRIMKQCKKYICEQRLPIIELPVGTVVYHKKYPRILDRTYKVYANFWLVEDALWNIPQDKCEGYINIDRHRVYDIIELHLWDDYKDGDISSEMEIPLIYKSIPR